MAKLTDALLKRLKPYTVVKITWADHHTQNGTFNRAKFYENDFSPCLRFNVGFFVGHNDEWLSICSTDDRQAGTGENDIEEVTTFVRSAVVDIQVLT